MLCGAEPLNIRALRYLLLDAILSFSILNYLQLE